MNDRQKKVLAILGSTRAESANLQLLHILRELAPQRLALQIYGGIGELPHFNPDVATEHVAQPVQDFYRMIQEADGVLICTPEYVFSLPGSLKNALEWTVATTLFADKPVALITASAMGEKAHDELGLIMKTLGARFNGKTQLLISGVRSRLNRQGGVTDEATLTALTDLMRSFDAMLDGV